MRLQTVISLFVFAASASSCGKKDEGGEQAPPKTEQSTEPKPAKPGPAETAPGDKATADKPVPAAGEEQCRRILEKSWAAVRPAVALQGGDPAALEASYKKGKYYLKACAGMSQEARDCLDKADNPVVAIHSCKVNEGKKGNDRLNAPSIRSGLDSFHVQPLSEAEQQGILASFVGTWVNDWKAAKLKTTWKVDKTGKVEQTSVRSGDKPEKKTFTVSFEKPGQMRVQWDKGSAQYFVFLPVDKKTVYAAGNAVYGFYPMQDEKSFTVENAGELVVIKDGKCTAIDKVGVTADARCEWGKEGKQRVFKIAYTLPGRLLKDGSPRQYENTYHLVGKNLLDYRLVSSGRFRRK